MTSFILILIIIILGSMYINRLIKYKFGDERIIIWKIIHIIAFIIVFVPFLCAGYLYLTCLINSYVIEKGLLVIAVLLYWGYNKYKKYKKIYNKDNR